MFLLADGIKAYEQLFVNQYKKAPWLFLLQDHGFGGNCDMFGRGGALDRTIQKEEDKPEFVICGANTNIRGRILQDGQSPCDLRRNAPHHQAPLYQELYEQIVRVLYIKLCLFARRG